MSERKSWEEDNLVFEMALRRMRSKSFFQRLQMHPRIMRSIAVLGAGYGAAIVTPLFSWIFTASLGYGFSAILTGVAYWTGSFMAMHVGNDRNRASALLARELRFSETEFREIIQVPIDALNYIEAMILWRHQELTIDFLLWLTVIVLLIPIELLDPSGMSFAPAAVAGFMVGWALVLRDEPRLSVMRAVLATLQRMCQEAVGIRPKPSERDPPNDPILLGCSGCVAGIVASFCGFLVFCGLGVAFEGLHNQLDFLFLAIVAGSFTFGFLMGGAGMNFLGGNEAQLKQTAIRCMETMLRAVQEE